MESSRAMPPSAERTLDLLARARAGDSSALDELFARYLPRLTRWAQGRLPGWARDTCDTQDLVQEALLQTFRRIGDFNAEREGALQAYLRQAVRNRIVDELRRVRRRPEAVVLDSSQASAELSPLQAAIGSENAERYERALARLRDEDREALIGRIEFGLTYAELAAALDKPSADAARKTARRALLKLAELLQDEA